MIVKKIVELHGGKVYVDTSLGQGTTFFLTLPSSAQAREEATR
jgi:signal transduction histidine kinase